MSLDCLACTLECCNSDASEIRHGNTNNKWATGELARRLKEHPDVFKEVEELLLRLNIGVDRVGNAMINCGRRVYVSNKKP